MDKYDFCGYATKANVRCGDGRTIMPNAFAHCDGMTVPLVWQHSHNNPNNVLGHGVLENRSDGVYVYGTFNDTMEGRHTKKMVKHGDITALSIYANNLKESNGQVFHGNIREVSLVFAGANPEAYIETVMAHSDEFGEEAIIYSGDELDMIYDNDNYFEHAENQNDDEETIGDIMDELTEKQKKAVYALVGLALQEKQGIKHSDLDDFDDFDDMDDEDDFDLIDYEGDDEMRHNVFDTEYETNDTALLHAEFLQNVIADAKKNGSLKESFLEHAATYGVDQIDWLYPDDKNFTNTPSFIKRQPDDWVSVVMNGVHHTPFSRIKTMFADITADEARAKGYIKGNRKKEEVFTLLKRRTGPTTVYKKQKMDRDDIVDITDFDVISWLKGEMRMMLDEELARAFLVGDGRSSASDDHINTDCIRPVIYDDSLFTIQYKVWPTSSETLEHAFVKAAVKSQNEYQGSGNLTLFISKLILTDLLLMEDGLGHKMYKDINELALALNVNRIVKLPNGILPNGIYGVMLDLKDYNVGADKGGAINMFDDFDIDYNQQKYLIETRCSGALTKPYSAIVLQASDVTVRENSVVRAARTTDKNQSELDAETTEEK